MARGLIWKGVQRQVIVFTLLLALPLSVIAIVQDLPVRAGAEYLRPIHPEEVTLPALRYQLLDKFGKVLWCDPDFHPLAITLDAEEKLAIAAFPEIRKAPVLFETIVRHLGLAHVTDFSDEQKLLVYREYKKLAGAIRLEFVGGKLRFSLLASTNEPGYEDKLGFRIEGFIDNRGDITIAKKVEEDLYYNCPICLSGATLIDTPRGPTAVRDVMVGMVVWTVGRNGNRHQAPVIRTSKTLVPITHEMVDLVLDDGRELIVSPGHPTIDGRLIGDLTAGDRLDGRRIVSAKRIPYTEAYTYDILPAGETGAYWADGILVASTIFDNQAKHAINEARKSARP